SLTPTLHPKSGKPDFGANMSNSAIAEFDWTGREKNSENAMIPDPFALAGETFGSRLLLGTAGYPTQRILIDAAAASGCEIVTVSIRRISLQGHGFDTVNVLSKYRFLPNTAGCENAPDAIRTAELAPDAPL